MMTEYESQHSYWQKDHDEIIAEMQVEKAQLEKYLHRIKVSDDALSDAEWFERWNWCGKNFVKETYRYRFGCFQFEHEQDAVLFILRWV